jgi:peroxiredoxin
MKWVPDFLNARVRPVPLAGAVVALGLAFVILWTAGIPNQAQHLDMKSEEQEVPGDAPIVGAAAPSFSANDVRGGFVSLSELYGAPVILNFWATWCGPCQVEMPDLQMLHEAHRDGGLHILAVNVDEPPEVFLPWAEARGITFGLIADSDGAIQRIYQLRGIPQTFVIGPAGIVRELFYGPISHRRLEQILDNLQ